MNAFRHPIGPERPASPAASYGVPMSSAGLVDWDLVVTRLAAERNYWLATVDTESRPHAMPVWGVLVDDDLYLETDAATLKARNIATNPAVAVHLEDGDRVVAAEGSAEPFVPGPVLGPQIEAAFAAKYSGYRPTPDEWDAGGLYRIVPRVLFAWNDMPSATRWRFGVAG